MLVHSQHPQAVELLPIPVIERQRCLPLRRIEREAVRYLNQIALQRNSIEFTWLSRPWSLRITPVTSTALTFAEVTKIDWGGADVMFRMCGSLLDMAAREVLQLENMRTLDGEIRAILVEAAFAGLASAVEDCTRKRFRLIETYDDSETPTKETHVDLSRKYGFLLALSDGKFDYECEAWIDDLALGFLASAVRGWTVQTTHFDQWDRLPLSFQITAGWTTLRFGAIRRLRNHDVVLLDECLVGGEEDQVLIRLGERLGIRGSITGSKITINDWLDDIMDETEDFEDYDESEEQASDPDTAVGDPDGLEQIPVRMNFDLGERMMTLAELRSLAPGYVIELGRDIRRAVTIRVNGKKIGEGELVDIDGYIGVSLLSINPPSV